MAYKASSFSNGYEFSAGTGYTLPTYPFVAPPELSSGVVKRHLIVIVGGGLAGLTLAASLASFGVRSVLLDEDNTVGVKGASSRGICYAQKTLEIFKRLGIYERIAVKGVQWSVGRTFAGHDEVYSFDLKGQQTHNLSTLPPFVNIQQFYVEGFLVERVLAMGLTDVRWQHRVTSFEQGAEHASLCLETPNGKYTIEAEYVIDATGSKSPFRTWVNAAITAKKGDDRWCIADVRFKEPPPIERHTWIEAPFNDNRAVWQHLMADDVWRLDYQMEPNCDMQAVSKLDTVLDRLQRQFAGQLDVRRDCEVVWVGPYAYKSECLNQLRHGRVFFVGDSAHVVSPFGARGGNSGVQDADNLAWKLAAVIQRQAAPALLNDYDEERHQAAVQNVLVTNRTARFLRPGNAAERMLRDAAIALAKRNTSLRPYVNTGRMSSPNEYRCTQPGLLSSKRALQNMPIRLANGALAEVLDLLPWVSHHLLVLWFGQTTERQAQALRQCKQRVVQVLACGEKGQHVECVWEPNESAPLRHACSLSDGWALVRPDLYIVATGNNVAHLQSAIRISLGEAA